MANKPKTDPRQARTSEICLSMPDATCEMANRHGIYRAKKRVFAYFLNNHHGDGIVSVCARTLPGDNAQLARDAPERFYLPAYIAHRGWVGYRLDVEPVDWDEVAELVRLSYQLSAGARAPSRKAAAPFGRGSEPMEGRCGQSEAGPIEGWRGQSSAETRH
jgi:hypothetical protein